MAKQTYFKVYDKFHNLILVTPVWSNVIEKIKDKVEEDLILGSSTDLTTQTYQVKKVLL